MADPTSQDLVLELLGRGLSRRRIGQLIGRNDRLIGYVEKGVKPGENLTASLAQVRAQLDAGQTPDRAAVTDAPRRQVTGTGGVPRLARVRRPSTFTGRTGRWSTTTVKAGAMKSGGRTLLHPLTDAAGRGHRVAVTLSTHPRVQVLSDSGWKGHGGVSGGASFTMELGDAGAVLAALAATGDDVTAYLVNRAVNAGHIRLPAGMAPAQAFTACELRAYDP